MQTIVSSVGAVIAIIVLVIAVVAWLLGMLPPLMAALFIGLAVARLT